MLSIKSSPARRRRRLEIELLEGRLAPAATRLAFEAALPALTAGQPIPAFKVDVLDENGQLDATSNASITVAPAGPGSFAAGGTTTSAAVNGVASFSDLSLLKSGGYSFTASAAGLTPATQNDVVVNAAAASLLVIDAAATFGATAGQPIPAFNVFVQDVFGNAATSGSVPVSAAVTGPGAFVSGSATVQSSNGIAGFSGLVLDKAGNYTLTVSAPGLTSATSPPFTIAGGAASKVAFVASPGTTTAGVSLAPINVSVQDAQGNPLSGTVVSLRVNGPANLASGTTAAVAANGVATFNDLVLRQAGTYSVTVSVLSGPALTSPGFSVVAAAAARLSFTVGPLGINAGQSLRTMNVTVQDEFGNRVTTSTAPVAIVANGPSPLSGTTTVNAVAGVAVFRGVRVPIQGSYTLTAASPGLRVAFSRTFRVQPVARSLRLFGVARRVLVGRPLPPIQVQVYDTLGLPLARANISVTLQLANASGTLTRRTDSRGVATFSNVMLRRAGVVTVTARATGLQSAASTITALANPVRLRFLTQPRAGRAGRVLAPIRVQLIDSFGNAARRTGVRVMLRVTSGRISGLLSRLTDRNGVATFSGLKLLQPGRYTLRASARSLAGAFSARFSVLSLSV